MSYEQNRRELLDLVRLVRAGELSYGDITYKELQGFMADLRKAR